MTTVIDGTLPLGKCWGWQETGSVTCSESRASYSIVIICLLALFLSAGFHILFSDTKRVLTESFWLSARLLNSI